VADKLQFGLIGCGSQGRFLSEGLKMTEKANLVACADPNPEATQRLMHQCGYQKACDSADAMPIEQA